MTRMPMTHVENCADVFALAAADRPRSRPNLERGRRPRRTNLDVSLGLHARQRRARLARARSRSGSPSSAVRLGFATVFRRATKVPSILIPRRLESRLKPLQFENRRLRETLGWTPPLDYKQCLARTYGSQPISAGRLAASAEARHTNVDLTKDHEEAQITES